MHSEEQVTEAGGSKRGCLRQVLKWGVRGFVMLAALAVLAWAAANLYYARALRAETAKIRATGEPLTFVELTAAMPEVKEVDDGGPSYGAALALAASQSVRASVHPGDGSVGVARLCADDCGLQPRLARHAAGGTERGRQGRLADMGGALATPGSGIGEPCRQTGTNSRPDPRRACGAGDRGISTRTGSVATVVGRLDRRHRLDGSSRSVHEQTPHL